MSAGITVTPPAGFQVSTTSGFSSNVGDHSSPITIGAAGTIVNTTVYVRLAATAPVSGNYNSQDIVLSSSGATAVNVATTSSGNTVTPATLTITANNQNKYFGTTQTTPVTDSTAFTAGGLKNGETVGSVTLSYSAGGLAADAAIGLTSTITPSAATGGTFTMGNYNLVYVSGTLTVASIATTTTLASSANPSTVGNSVTFTAAIVPASGVTVPTGSVQFKINGVTLGAPITVTTGTSPTGTASIATSALPIGTNAVTAEYTAGSCFVSSTGTLSGGQVVNVLNMISNGSFETGKAIPPGGVTSVSSLPSADLSGWSGTFTQWYGSTNWFPSQDGARFLNLLGATGAGFVSQSFPVTAGYVYSVSYYEKRRGFGGFMDATVSVAAGTVTGANGSPVTVAAGPAASIVQTTAANANWLLHRFKFTPNTTTTATLSFGNIYGGGRGGDNDGVFLDNVSVTTGDSDGDGIPDSIEAMCGTDPANAASAMKITSIDPTNAANLTLQFGVGSNRTVSILAADSPTGTTHVVMSITNTAAFTNFSWTEIGAITTSPMRRFYTLVSVSDGGTYTNTEEWAMYVQPRVSNRWVMAGMPVDFDTGSNTLAGTLGAQLTRGVQHGDEGSGDLVYLLEEMGSSTNFLKHWSPIGTTVWYANNLPTNTTIYPWTGFWVQKRTTSPSANAVYTGRARTNLVYEVPITNGWNFLAWPCRTDRKESDNSSGSIFGTNNFGWGFLQSGGIGNTIATNADTMLLVQGNSWKRYYLLSNGRWWDYLKGGYADFTMQTGQGFYYFRRGTTGFTWTNSYGP